MPGARFVLEALRAAPPDTITRPAHLLALVPRLASAAALDIAAALLDAGELVTDGGALHEGRPPAPPAGEVDLADGRTFGEGTRAILRAIGSAPKRERTAPALSPAVLLFASFFREQSIAGQRLRDAVRGLGVRVRDWDRCVNQLRQGERVEELEHDAAEDDRGVVLFDPSRVDLAVERSLEHLESDTNLFQRSGALATVVSVTAADVKRFPFLVKDAPRVSSMAAPTLLERLCRFVRFEVRRGDRVVVKGPPSEVVAAIHAREELPGIRPLRGVIETPTLRPVSEGGGVVSTPGYDARLGYYYRPPHGVVFLTIAEAPSREDATEAFAALLDTFVDFPFETDAGRSAAVAAVLTMIARPAVEGAIPIFLFDATTQGTGKTLAVDVIHKLATGRLAGKFTMPVDRKGIDEAELRKILASVVQSAAASTTLDNIEPPAHLGGSALAHAVTTGIFEGRRMGTDKAFRVPWETVLFATGNNVSVSPDVYRRTLLIRLTSPYEKPQLRPRDSYVHPERAGADQLLSWAGTQHPRLVTAALTVLRAFIVAGCPRQVPRFGSFEAWCDLVASAVVWAGGADPTSCFMGADEANERPDEAALRVVLRDLPRLDERRRGLTIKEILALLYPPERVRGEHLAPDGFEDLREALEELVPPSRTNAPPNAREVGNRLRAFLGKLAGGRRLQQGRSAQGGLVRWVVVDAPRPDVAPMVQSVGP